MSLRLIGFSALCLIIADFEPANAQNRRPTGKPYVDMNYGPNLTASITVGEGNIAYKGIAVRLDEGSGGVSAGKEFVVFDTDTLRYAAAWSGKGFLDWRSVVFDGSHNTNPAIVGNVVYLNRQGPGYGKPGTASFEDPRFRGHDDLPYGPLPRSWGHWKGHYHFNDRVILHYTVGKTEVLESPSVEGPADNRFFVRTINAGPRQVPLLVQVATEKDTTFEIAGNLAATKQSDKPAQPRKLAFDGQTALEVANSDQLDFSKSDFTIAARIKTRRGGTILAKAPRKGKWAPDGTTFFVRGGRLCYDIGWVGVVTSRHRVADGRWHDVAAAFDSKQGRLDLYVDGKLSGSKEFRPENRARDQVVRIGYTSPNFPNQSGFVGDIERVAFFQRKLTADELKTPAKAESPAASWDIAQFKEGTLQDQTKNGHHATLSAAGKTAPRGRLVAGFRDAPAGTKWITTKEGDLRLKIPAGDDDARFKIVLARVPKNADDDAMRKVFASSPPTEDLSRYTNGGPPRWNRELTTTAKLAENDAPYVVDKLTLPRNNPWRSWMRMGGFDFFSDSNRGAICTWMGDVWIVEGLGGELGELRWRRIATGMFQPLGLKIVDDEIYVTCRDQITRLVDLNGDGETDYYENFNNDHQVTEHFHEFAMDLQTDAEGNFYYAKSARHAKDSLVPHHGTLIKVSPDGSHSEIVCNGFRAANGVGIGPDGEMATSDQEGHWTPANRINLVQKDGFYGNMYSYHRGEHPETYLPPVVWLPKNVDRSPAEQLWVTSDKWGPLTGSMISTSYGTGQIFVVPYEYVDGVPQGAAFKLPLSFPTGIMRARFHPEDGQLYVCGLFGWSSNKTQSGGFYRVRYTGQEVAYPVGFHAAKNGIELRFSAPLDAQSATDADNYSLAQWNYRWTANYGSKHYSVADPRREGEDPVDVASVSLSDDRRSVFLEIPDIQPVMTMRIAYTLKSAKGTPLRHTLHATLNKLGPPRDRKAPHTVSPLARDKNRTPGLQLSFKVDEKNQDARVSRLAALHVPPGTSPTPFVSDDESYTAEFTGYVRVDLKGEYDVSIAGSGTATLTINGKTLFKNQPLPTKAHRVTLAKGDNAVRLRYTPPADGPPTLRLQWASDAFVTEPIPAVQLVHDPGDKALKKGLLRRQGRELFALRRCYACHEPHPDGDTFKMPEMAFDAPSLQHAGSRLAQAWMARWILDPQSLRSNVTMPRLFDPEDGADRQKASDIAAYLARLGKPSREILEPLADASLKKAEYLFEDLACIGCHRVTRPEAKDEFERTSLKFLGTKYQPGALVDFLRKPTAHYKAIRMPDFRLSHEESALLAGYIRAQNEARPPTAKRLPRGNATRGKKLFESVGCASCHPVSDKPPARKSIQVKNLDGGCLAATPEAETPDFSLSKEDRAAVARFLTHDVESLERFSLAEAGERVIRRRNCTACHTRDAHRGDWGMIFVEEGVRGTIPEYVPPLTWAGEKLRTEWMHRLFAGAIEEKPRPFLKVRMPVFAPEAKTLALGLAAQHGFPQKSTAQPPTPATKETIEIGRRLTLKQGGFNCIQCHDRGPQKATAAFEQRGVDFTRVTKRMRYEFYPRWMLNPPRLEVSTKMPLLAPDRKKTSVTDVYNGDARRQFDAIWWYLQEIAGNSKHEE